ncbi:hypothetical protein [Sphingobacterium lactis]|uniref:Uncharacterized protein n=1 Tax=Sphingobacterium lactis TaxID=797291 RepID=A0A1H6BPC7_9SPHI|nr:hypothetical protein [Sphingobacterium lactis]SEG62543.1 hypothetical protein SAMN05421877_11139 [Sphingobacterium lactis]
MEYIKKIIDLVKPRTTRAFKGGVELRGINMESAKQEIRAAIELNQWPVEIFDTDVRLKSISIREK